MIFFVCIQINVIGRSARIRNFSTGLVYRKKSESLSLFLFCQKYLLKWHASEADELADGAALMLAMGDNLLLLLLCALEELAYVGEAEILFEIVKEAGIGDAEGTRGEVEDGWG